MSRPSPSQPGDPADARIRETSAFFDAAVREYDDSFDEPGPDGYALRSRQAAVLDLLRGPPGRVLDAGMGPGRLCAELASRGWDVSGVDASPGMVAAARARLPSLADRIGEGRVEALPFDDGTFDAVVCTGVLEYVAQPERAMAELARVTRPGGQVVVAAPNTHALYVRWKHFVFYPAVTLAKRRLRARRPPPLRRPWPADPGRVQQRLARAGLRVVDVRPAAFAVLPSPLDELMPRAAVRLAERFERGRRGSGRRLAAQLLLSTRRAPGPSGAVGDI